MVTKDNFAVFFSVDRHKRAAWKKVREAGMWKLSICMREHEIDHDNAYEPCQEISNFVVCATSKASDQPAHTRSLIRAFASRLSII